MPDLLAAKRFSGNPESLELRDHPLAQPSVASEGLTNQACSTPTGSSAGVRADRFPQDSGVTHPRLVGDARMTPELARDQTRSKERVPKR
jgi:hypothetical protein